jgi:HSP20 family molecular chaperone IbpA
MERAVDEAIIRAKSVYEMVTGQPAPEVSPSAPYARIPPEVDREEHVLRQAAALFERVQRLDQPAQPVQPAVRDTTISRGVDVCRDGNELQFVFDVGNNPRDRISVELQGVTLRVSVEQESKERISQSAYLPARVEPSAVKAELKDSSLTVRVRMPLIDDVLHKIEIR